jgi:hypothetical protein
MWYDVGTISVTNGSTTVTGSGTDFISGVQVGEGLYIGGDLYEIAVINSSTQLTLADAYLGSTATGQDYKIIPTQSLVADLSSGVADLISDFADVRDYAGNGKFDDGTATQPAITFTQDQNNGLYRIGSDNYGLSAGGQLIADVSTSGLGLPDGKKATFGTGDDLQIYHDGSNSYIADVGTGNLNIRGHGFLNLQKYDGENFVTCASNGAVTLYYDDASKLATAYTGVDVTGTVTADSLTVQTAQGNINVRSDASAVDFLRDGTNYFRAIGASGDFRFTTGNGGYGNVALTIDDNNDVYFYEDTGTTAKMVWDASAESLGIGVTDPSSTLDIADSFGAINLESSTGTNQVQVKVLNTGGSAFFGRENSAGSWFGTGEAYATTLRSDGAYPMIFRVNGENRLVLDDGGNVGIGTSSPDYTLEVAGRAGFGLPNTTLPALGADTANFRIGNFASGNINYGTMFGTLGSGDGYIQQQRFDGNTEAYDLLLQPNGGNVGIGTASPSAKLSVAGDSYFADDGTNGRLTINSDTTQTTINSTTTNFAAWETLRFRGSDYKWLLGASSEAMRLDSSGNLLVGKTSPNSNLKGVELRPDFGVFTSDANVAIISNRKTNDGVIHEFQKDGSTVGSIGASQGSTYIGSGDVGLLFRSSFNAIYPSDSSGSFVKDNSIDIGGSTQRFKDLYLSGGVYLGGTGSANKLDDYETGTWSYTQWSAPANLTVNSTRDFRYTKVGRMVTITGEINVSVTSGSVETSVFLILPFAAENASFADTGVAHIITGSGANRFGVGVVMSPTYNSTSAGIYFPENQINGSDSDSDIGFTLTYMTA